MLLQCEDFLYSDDTWQPCSMDLKLADIACFMSAAYYTDVFSFPLHTMDINTQIVFLSSDVVEKQGLPPPFPRALWCFSAHLAPCLPCLPCYMWQCFGKDLPGCHPCAWDSPGLPCAIHICTISPASVPQARHALCHHWKTFSSPT